MPKSSAEPRAILPYMSLGMEIDWEDRSSGEAVANCPFCDDGEDRKRFHINFIHDDKDEGLWACRHRCKIGGNQWQFMRLLWERSSINTTEEDYYQLATQRKLLPETLVLWGCVKSIIEPHEWLVPGYAGIPNFSKDKEGKDIQTRDIVNLYRYTLDPLDPMSGRRVLVSTTSGAKPIGHGLFGANLYDPAKPTLKICEGPWDGMALFETLKLVKRTTDDDGIETLESCNVPHLSLLASCNVIAVPGCNVWKDTWTPLCAGKSVHLLYDNDYPKEYVDKKDGLTKEYPPAGWEGMKRVARILLEAQWSNLPAPKNAANVGKKAANSNSSPESISYLSWHDEPSAASNHNPDVPNGYDVRDFLTVNPGKPISFIYDPSSPNQSQSIIDGGMIYRASQSRIEALDILLSKVVSLPEEWVEGIVPGSNGKHAASGKEELQPLPCEKWSEVVDGWSKESPEGNKALHWNEGLERSLACMLACAMSTPFVGDQLWIRIISPASGGKTTLAEGLLVSKKYTKLLSLGKGLYSAYKPKGKDGEQSDRDVSMIVKLQNKTGIVKDADTLHSLPNLRNILAQLRDVYDRHSAAHYNNDIDREYDGQNTTIIILGTPNVYELDSSELGERFLDVVMMNVSDVEGKTEREVARQVIRNSQRNLKKGYESNCSPETTDSPERIRAKRLTGGYLHYLRANGAKLFSEVKDMTTDQEDEIYMYALYIVYMRARQPKKQQEWVERELCYRVSSQLSRLATCLAVVYNKTEIDDQLMNSVKKVSLDSARGTTKDVVSAILKGNGQALTRDDLETSLGIFGKKMGDLLIFLRRIGIIEGFRKCIGTGILTGQESGPTYWRLTRHFKSLYEQVNKTNTPSQSTKRIK